MSNFLQWWKKTSKQLHDVAEVATAVRRVESAVTELCGAYAAERAREADRAYPVTVCVLGNYLVRPRPDKATSEKPLDEIAGIHLQGPEPPSRVMPFVGCKTELLQAGSRFEFDFAPQRAIAPGAWVFCIGPAKLSCVRVGQNEQSCWMSDGPILYCRDECQVGIHIYAQVEVYPISAFGMPSDRHFRGEREVERMPRTPTTGGTGSWIGRE